MTWTDGIPDGSKSVKQNESPLANNLTYTKATLGPTANDTTNTDIIKDHYFDVDSNFDGRHRYVNSPAYTISGDPTDPVIGAGMDGVSFLKSKTALQSPDNEDVQPHYRNSGQVMQIPTCRAMIVFDLTPNSTVANAPAAAVKYAFNLDAAALSVTNMIFAKKREFTLTFSVALPSRNYFINSGAVMGFSGNSRNHPLFVKTPDSGENLNNVKSTTLLTMNFPDITLAAEVPLQVWVAVYGG